MNFMQFIHRADSGARSAAPMAATQSAGGGVLITTPDQLDAYIRSGDETAAGVPVTPDSAMRVATVNGCVRIISGAVSTLPLHIVRKVDDQTREDASDTPVGRVLSRKPNGWMKPATFRRMMQAHVLLRGNAYALIVQDARQNVTALIPLHPDRVRVEQLEDLSVVYHYRRKKGGEVLLSQRDVLHLVGLTFDGVTGVSMIAYARETIGMALAMQRHGASTFKNGAQPGSVLTAKNKLGPEGIENLKTSLDIYRGSENAGKALILEEDMTFARIGMSAVDAQFVETIGATRTDIAMFFGVPPHMLGDTTKSTSWGTGIEQQSIGFVTWTLEDHLTMWEEAINVDLLDDDNLRAKFNRSALVKGDIKARWDAYVKALQWGVFSPDDVLALEDRNPRADGQGGKFYDPPNTAGETGGDDGDTKEPGDEPPEPA